VPKQSSSGGKPRLGSISKQGDRYLRGLFTAGALAVIRYAKIHAIGHTFVRPAASGQRPGAGTNIRQRHEIDRLTVVNVSASCCSIKRLGGNSFVAILLIGCSGRSCWKSHDTERRHSNQPLPVVLPRRPRNKSRTSQAAMMGITTSVRSGKIPCLGAERRWPTVCLVRRTTRVSRG
jgi:Transposase IS116/IS110/IS902 family